MSFKTNDDDKERESEAKNVLGCGGLREWRFSWFAKKGTVGERVFIVVMVFIYERGITNESGER